MDVYFSIDAYFKIYDMQESSVWTKAFGLWVSDSTVLKDQNIFKLWW